VVADALGHTPQLIHLRLLGHTYPFLQHGQRIEFVAGIRIDAPETLLE
jgi:hypothetical protein